MTDLKGMILIEAINTNIDIAKKTLYQYQVYFNNFKDIDENIIKEIKNDIDKWNKKIFSLVRSPQKTNVKLARYLSILNFVNGYKFNNRHATFDEKIVFLLYALDPEMQMYDIYQENLDTFNNNEKKGKESDQIINKIRDEFGFYDRKLLEYEAKFITRFILKFSKNVNPSVFYKFQLACLSLENFDELDSSKNDDIILKSENYLAKYNKPSYKTLSYQLLYQANLLGVKVDYEKALFFILVMDKDLRMLHIYEEASTWKEIGEKIKEEFGFFSKRMVLLEKKYHQRFYPDLDISWIKKKEI